MSRPHSGSSGYYYSPPPRHRSTSARPDSHSQALDHSAKFLGRNICVVVTIFGVVIAVGGGFAIGFVTYPYMTNAHDRTAISDVELQSDDLENNEVILNDKPGVQVELDSVNCGKSAVPLQRILQLARITSDEPRHFRSRRIVGGEASSSRSFPWQVSLWTGNHHTCGGSFISSNWIITAAHCTAAYPEPENWTVYAGANSITEMTETANTTQIFRLTDVVTHSKFNSTTYHNDVALMRTERHFVMNERVAPICLPRAGENVEAGEECLISGWGALSEGGSMPKKLQKATVTVIDLYVCNRDDWLMGLAKDSMICAGTESGNMDACQGDSGGPLSCSRKSSGQFYLPGLVSWGIGCGEPRMPGVYTRLTNYRSWIMLSIQDVEKIYP